MSFEEIDTFTEKGLGLQNNFRLTFISKSVLVLQKVRYIRKHLCDRLKGLSNAPVVQT